MHALICLYIAICLNTTNRLLLPGPPIPVCWCSSIVFPPPTGYALELVSVDGGCADKFDGGPSVEAAMELVMRHREDMVGQRKRRE